MKESVLSLKEKTT